jgi:hypothetical protein
VLIRKTGCTGSNLHDNSIKSKMLKYVWVSFDPSCLHAYYVRTSRCVAPSYSWGSVRVSLQHPKKGNIKHCIGIMLRSYQRISPGPRHFETFRNNNKFLRWRVSAPRPTPKLETTLCRLSATVYSIYSQLPSVPGGLPSIRNLRTRHAVVTSDPPGGSMGRTGFG